MCIDVRPNAVPPKDGAIVYKVVTASLKPPFSHVHGERKPYRLGEWQRANTKCADHRRLAHINARAQCGYHVFLRESDAMALAQSLAQQSYYPEAMAVILCETLRTDLIAVGVAYCVSDSCDGAPNATYRQLKPLRVTAFYAKE